jgi:hypothetical protein
MSVSTLIAFVLLMAGCNDRAAHSSDGIMTHTNRSSSTEAMINAMTATNLQQWKDAIKGLQSLGEFTIDQHWAYEKPGRQTGISILLSQEGKTLLYSTVLVSLNAKNDASAEILSVEMQTPNMNADETRTLGVQLCEMLKRDPSDFLTWCDKVGNHWLDAPLYSTGGSRLKQSNRHCGFGILRTYNNDRPWCINLFISAP